MTQELRVRKMDCPQCGAPIGYVSNGWMGERVELIGERTQSLTRTNDTVAIKITHTFRVHKCARYGENFSTIDDVLRTHDHVEED